MSDAAPGRLTIILGYAAGTGKTFRMLEDGHRLAAAGRDVVIGYFEPHARPETIALTAGLETVPRRTLAHRGRPFEEMDTAAILARRPEVCLVDEFPHTNVPGSARAKRYEDVLLLIDHGIDVVTTMNIQHLESLNDQVRDISGVEVRETVPDWVLARAAEITLVDLTPGALLNRLDRGVVYSPEKAQAAKLNFFREPTLATLRELALRQTAHSVDLRRNLPASTDRILIHLTPAPNTVALIRRGHRVAGYLRAACFAVAVVPGPGLAALPAPRREALLRHLDFARRLHIETRLLDADDPAAALAAFARTNSVTQIFLAKPAPTRFPLLSADHRFVRHLIRAARSLQVTVVADRSHLFPAT